MNVRCEDADAVANGRLVSLSAERKKVPKFCCGYCPKAAAAIR